MMGRRCLPQTFDRCIDSPVKINYNEVKTTKEAVAFAQLNYP